MKRKFVFPWIEEKGYSSQMSFFESLKAAAGQVLDLIEKNPQIIEGVKKIVEDNGGVQGLVQKFKEKGLSDVASSWVGKGENLSLGADDVLKVLGNDSISDLAKSIGIDKDQTAGIVGSLLPSVIDGLTPDGEEPKGDVASQLTNLASLFLKK